MKKSIVLYVLLIGYLLLNIFVMTSADIPLYNEVINPVIWVILCVIAVLFSQENSIRVKDENNKMQSLIIAMIIYIIFYFLLGLVFGFQKTPYSKDLLSILRNVWSFGSIVVFQEYIRYSMIKLEHKKNISFALIIVLFALLDLSYVNFLGHFDTVKEGFIYTVTTLIPVFVTSALLTYLSYVGGAKLPIIYRLFIILPEFIVPIIPALDWFISAVIGIMLPVAVFVYLNYVHIQKTERLSKRSSRKYNPVVYLPAFIIIAILSGFMVGLFKFQPIAMLSGSMSPTFNRGDAVIVNKLTTAEKDNLKVNDIIQFTSGSKYVVHRIVDETNDENGNRLFITKGDYNNTNDLSPVDYEQIVGKVSFTIPYIGYPAVWLSGMVS